MFSEGEVDKGHIYGYEHPEWVNFMEVNGKLFEHLHTLRSIIHRWN